MSFEDIAAVLGQAFGMELNKPLWIERRAARVTVSLPKEAILPLTEKGTV